MVLTTDIKYDNPPEKCQNCACCQHKLGHIYDGNEHRWVLKGGWRCTRHGHQIHAPCPTLTIAEETE